jgi:Response regulators consisting of a CheY-like receiver domain and a winged-helix DNA-binding domain
MTKAFLENTNGEQIGKIIELDHKEISIGRTSDCSIVIEPRFTSVSQCHAILRRTLDGWAIIDIGTYGKGSSYGTYVNDIRITPNKEVILHSGDEIRLGTKLGKYLSFRGEGTMLASEPISLLGRFTIDTGKRCVLVDSRVLPVSLTPQEFEFLVILWQKTGSICIFKEICIKLWPNENIITSAPIDADLKVRINTLAYELRRKLKFALDGIDILENCRGVGYRLRL